MDHISILSQIAICSNSIDKYLTYFETNRNDVSKEQFIEMFLLNVHLNPKDRKIVQTELPLIPLEVKIILNIESLNEIKLIYAKEFSMHYLTAVKNLSNIANHITSLFSQIGNYEQYYQESIEMVQNSIDVQMNINNLTNQVQRKLLPFSFPFSLPRLFTPVSIYSKDKVIKFIEDNQLYSKQIQSLEKFEKELPFTEPIEQQSLISSNHQQSSSDIQHSFSNLSLASDTEEELNLQSLRSKESSLRLYYHNLSRFTSVFPTHLTIRSSNQQSEIASIFNCILKRLNYSFPAAVSVSLKNIRIIPFVTYRNNKFRHVHSILNMPLNPHKVYPFVMDVVNGFWGPTKLFEGRIVIKIPINTILHISRNSSNCFCFWTLRNGSFMLDNVTSSVISLLQMPFNQLFETYQQIIDGWKSNTLSTSQTLIALNKIKGMEYSNSTNFLMMPDNLSIFGVPIPITDSLIHNLNKHSLELNGKLGFSNSIEYDENLPKVLNFIQKFNVQANPITKTKKVSTCISFNSAMICQKVKPNNILSLILNDSKINQQLVSPVTENGQIYLEIQKSTDSILLIDHTKHEVVYQLHSQELYLAESLSVSQNRMFFAVDLMIGNTLVYRIIKDSQIPVRFELITKKSFLYSQKSAINGLDLVCGTFSDKFIYIWLFSRLTNHLVIEFDDLVSSLQFDDNSSTFWVCSNNRLYFFSINGNLYSKHEFESKITSFCVIPKKEQEIERIAICGLDDGSVVLITPQIETGKIEIKKLQQSHTNPVVTISASPKGDFFLTSDDNDCYYLWTNQEVKNEI